MAAPSQSTSTSSAPTRLSSTSTFRIHTTEQIPDLVTTSNDENDDAVLQEGDSLGDLGRRTLGLSDSPEMTRRRVEKGKGRMKEVPGPFDDEMRSHEEIDEEDEEVEEEEMNEEKQREEERRISENLAQWSNSESKRRAQVRRSQTLHVLPPAPPLPSATVLARRSSALLRKGSKRVSKVLAPHGAGSIGSESIAVDHFELSEDSPRSKRRGQSRRLDSYDGNQEQSIAEETSLTSARSPTIEPSSSSPRSPVEGEASWAQNPFASPPTTPQGSSYPIHRVSAVPSRFTEDLPSQSPTADSPIASARSSMSNENATPRQMIDSPLLVRKNPMSAIYDNEEDDGDTPRKPGHSSSNPFSDGSELGPPAHITPNMGRGLNYHRNSDEDDDTYSMRTVVETDSGERDYERRIYSNRDEFLPDEDERSKRRWEELDKRRRRRAEFGFLDWLLCGCWNGQDGDEDEDQQARTNPME